MNFKFLKYATLSLSCSVFSISAFADWKKLRTDDLINYLGQDSARVSGVQVIPYINIDNQYSIMVGKIAAWKKDDMPIALTSGKPEQEEINSGNFEAAAYRELLEEFGIDQNWGVKSQIVLVNDAGKFGIKLVYLLELDNRFSNLSEWKEQMTFNIKKILFEQKSDKDPEYIDWFYIDFIEFKNDITAKESKLNWRKFDQRMFNDINVLALIEETMINPSL